MKFKKCIKIILCVFELKILLNIIQLIKFEIYIF